MNPRVRLVLAVLAIAIGVAAWPTAFAPIWGTAWERTLVIGIVWAFVAAGLVAWSRRPENGLGKTLTAAGFAFFFHVLEGSNVPVIFTVAAGLALAWLPTVFFSLLSYPSGRLTSRLNWIPLGLAIIAASISAAFLPFYDPVAFGCADCRPGVNLILIRADPTLVDNSTRASGLVIIAALVLLAAVIIRRTVVATVPARRVLAPLLFPAGVFLLSYLGYLVFQQVARQGLWDLPTVAYQALATALVSALFLLPLTFLLGLSRYRARRARVSDLVVELGKVRKPERLRDALARTLGDPELEVGFWVPEASRYLSADGTPVDIPEEAARTATYLEREAEPLAVIVHDGALLDDPGLVDAVAAAATLAVENDRLQAAVRAQLEEVRASRLRIIQAADEERRRIERNLHDGAQARLLSLSLALQVANAKLEESPDPDLRRLLAAATDELRSALAELRELARGIHPAVLTDEGLRAAIEVLADRAPIRIRVDSLPNDRLPGNVEAAAYYVVSEAIANTVKYARASHIAVSARREGRDLVVEISDDGVGGATVEAGRGLRGLTDRIQALDGDLEIKSPPGSGTRIVARIPCG